MFQQGKQNVLTWRVKNLDFASVRGWGHSSVGRASEWHSEGQEFDPPWLHHPSPNSSKNSSRLANTPWRSNLVVQRGRQTLRTHVVKTVQHRKTPQRRGHCHRRDRYAGVVRAVGSRITGSGARQLHFAKARCFRQLFHGSRVFHKKVSRALAVQQRWCEATVKPPRKTFFRG